MVSVTLMLNHHLHVCQSMSILCANYFGFGVWFWRVVFWCGLGLRRCFLLLVVLPSWACEAARFC